MVNSCRMASLNTKSLQKSWIAHELWFKDFDCNISQDYFIMRSPNLTHPSDSNAVN
jgi:hypothetical protein